MQHLPAVATTGYDSDPQVRLRATERGLAHADPESRIFSMEAWSAAIEHLAEVME